MTQSLNDESRKHIEQVAGEALAQLESIAETAKSKLHDGRTLGSDALASINTMTSSSAIQRLDQISQANRESYQVLVAEPAIARVVVADEEGEEKTYYICRTTPVSGFPNLASYRAPVGRLASLAIGAEFTLPNGTVVEVLERAQLRPNALADGWDSRDTVVVFFVDSNTLAACFDASGSIDEAFVKELAKQQPLRVVFRDAGYKNSAVKINVEQIFKLLSPATEVKCI